MMPTTSVTRRRAQGVRRIRKGGAAARSIPRPVTRRAISDLPDIRNRSSLETRGTRIFVNVPPARHVAVVESQETRGCRNLGRSWRGIELSDGAR